MSTYSDLVAKIKAAADSSTDVVKVAIGSTGNTVTIDDVEMSTGKAWQDPSFIAVLQEGLSDWLDDPLISKLNELIGQYNQLRSDYNSMTVPTSANSVSTL